MLRALFVTLICCTALTLAAADDPSPVGSDIRDLVFFDASRPVFVRVHLQIDGKPPKAGQTFAISALSPRPAQIVDLFGLLDRDGDGRLSWAEVEAARQSVRKLDIDDDDTFNIAELRPYLDPNAARNNPQQPADARIEIPFAAVDASDESITALAANLLRRYDREENKSDTGRLTPAELGVDKSAIDPFDSDTDGGLNAAELAKFLHTPPVQVELLVQFYVVRPARPKVTLVKGTATPVTGPATADRLNAVLGGADMEFRATSSATTAAFDNRQFYKLNFYTKADRDKNKYVDEQEFPALELPGVEFKTIDADSDGKIFLEELEKHLDKESAESRERLELVISQDGKALFEIFDANSDRRLSRREFNTAVERLRPYDRDGDGRLGPTELAGRYKATFELGKPTLFQNRPAPNMAARTNPLVTGTTNGPEWFRKMDFNRDGDVSRREFLGPLHLFDKLDINQDGLLDPLEAGAATFSPP